jgi:hypothetical protein
MRSIDGIRIMLDVHIEIIIRKSRKLDRCSSLVALDAPLF